MAYYDDADNVEQYTQLAEGYDGRELVAVLRHYLESGTSVLELGMGPGKDLVLLAEHYTVTGSDSSQIFVDRYLHEHPGSDVTVLDAITLEIDRNFDAIYSNKVLQHLTPEQLAMSFHRQAAIVVPGGIVLHSLWYGEGSDNFAGLLSVYYTEKTLEALYQPYFELLTVQRYTEMDEDDSFYVVLRRLDE